MAYYIKKCHLNFVRKVLGACKWEMNGSEVKPEEVDFDSVCTGENKVLTIKIGEPREDRIEELEWRQSAGRSVTLQMEDTAARAVMGIIESRKSTPSTVTPAVTE